MLRRLVLAAAVAALVPSAAQAGGFAVSEAGSPASGRGTAAAALYGDASAVFFNPANVSRTEGLQLMLGASALMPRWTYQPNGSTTTTKSEFGVIPPPNFSAAFQLGKTPIGHLGAGVGLYVPYGSTFAWPADWAGREQIQQIGLTVFEVEPVLALRPHKLFALGAGFRYLPASVVMKQAVRFGSTEEGVVELGGAGSGMGASAGLSFFPTDALSLGLTWRSGVTLKMTGAADFDFPAPFEPKAVDRDVRTEVPLAQVFRVGAAFQAIPDKLSLSADFEYQMWSAFKELAITFIADDGTETKSASPRDSADSFVVHAGAEFRPAKGLALRAGYVWDQHTLPEATVNPAPPDSDKHVVSLGVSYDFGKVALHGHFSNVFFAPRTSYSSEFPGEWHGAWPGGTMAYMVGLALSARLDLAAPFGGGEPAAAPEAAAAPEPGKGE